MFNIEIVLCLISVNFLKNEKYILSMTNDSIQFPKLEIKDVDSINNIVHNYISQIFINPRLNEIDRIRFISFNPKEIKILYGDSKNTIHVLYGGTLSNMETMPNYTWVPFDYMDLNLKKELSLVNLTLQHVI